MKPIVSAIEGAVAFAETCERLDTQEAIAKAFEEAVRAFEPYRLVQEPNESARDGLRQVADHSRRLRQPAFLFVNNRLEGHAPTTIEAVVDACGW